MNPIEKNAFEILKFLVEKGISQIEAKELAKALDLTPEEINDATSYLESLGAVTLFRSIGTAPYLFSELFLESKGKFLYYEITKGEEESVLPKRPINPVGSPYGFTDKDWEFVTLRKRDRKTLYVVIGLQYKSNYYNINDLLKNMEEHFKKVIELYNEKHKEENISLKFEKLEGGYGEHLFNEIARMIIGSDIAIFDTSDLNPNVMIELGVALTWGIRVLPIREKNSPEPPSDISGQTWIMYEDSGKILLDENVYKKLEIMIERAIAKKGKEN